MDTQLRIDFTKEVNVIGHYFKFQHFTAQLFRNLINNLFQTFVHATQEYLAAILRTKDNMLFAGVSDMAVALKLRFIGHTFYHTVMSYMTSRFAPYIPLAKARGFTVLIGKGNVGYL